MNLKIIFYFVTLLLISKPIFPSDSHFYKIVGAKGKNFLDRDKAVIGMKAKVGNTFKSKSETSYIDITFLGAILRLVNGQLTIIESNEKKRSPEKMLLESGKVYFFLDHRLEKNYFHLATNRFIISYNGQDLKAPIRGYVEVLKHKTLVHLLNGQVDITIARVNKKYRLPLNAGEYLESNGKDDPKPHPFADEHKHQKILNVISQIEASSR